MDFNKKIAKKILADLQSAKKYNLSFKKLEDNICQNLAAVDSTFLSNIKIIIEGVLSKIAAHQQKQYASTLNTPEEGTYDEFLPIGNLFDHEIACLEEYRH